MGRGGPCEDAERAEPSRPSWRVVGLGPFTSGEFSRYLAVRVRQDRSRRRSSDLLGRLLLGRGSGREAGGAGTGPGALSLQHQEIGGPAGQQQRPDEHRVAEEHEGQQLPQQLQHVDGGRGRHRPAREARGPAGQGTRETLSTQRGRFSPLDQPPLDSKQALLSQALL